MEPGVKRKGPLGLAKQLDVLVKPQPVEYSQVLSQSSLFTSLFKSQIVTTFVRWDAFYFVHIAEEGYIYEQEYAFFPMLPFLMKGISATDHKSILVLSGIIISNVSFALATATLYHLSYSIFKKERFALISALCFCFTPSCMFMSSMYTESLFALLTFVGMDLYIHRWFWSAAIVWSFSTLTRSNGVVYVGFFIFDLCIKNRSSSAVVYMTQVLKAMALSLVTFLGMASFQMYGYLNYCANTSQPRPWCQARIPLLYSFVQEEYWNCGLFRYYEWKQLPNFLLAAPMVLLSFCGIWSYAAHDLLRFFSVGILKATREEALLPFIYLWGVLLVYCTLAMHIQVITRFFSCMPTVYWFAAHLLAQDTDNSKRKRVASQIVLFYFITYGLVGIVLFSNFFPPA
ncbi:mannosyltransferase [Basidiobolus meristosporus CBS 931.73]|uniref:GPI mannosyltransferase 2 n=1 Tax=Basidiobolus meristosporus CBS 931.73 TaxID=1314790 RepID=A0A1Y1XVW8_9FUNG|nr:mannosyltransferase [Basidiobolus meristosporus CBS 931.73]|eukprot:ORX89815.1 mannosyltransferase [Basidiobolus meristosporus CBS 931.73]